MISGKIEKQYIVVFDFDGTITQKDTLFDFIDFYKGRFRLLMGLLVLSPVLIAYKLRIIKNSRAKQQLFSFFFKGESIEIFNRKCYEYIKRINTFCYRDSLDKILWHQQQGHTVIVISASISNWISPWADTMKIDNVLSTNIEVKNNILTGKFSSENCYGQEKVNRLLKAYPDRQDYILYAYGDSRGDKELLALADFPTLYKR